MVGCAVSSAELPSDWRQIHGQWNFTNFTASSFGGSNIAIENGPVEIVDLAIKHGGSFHSYVNVYQRLPSQFLF